MNTGKEILVELVARECQVLDADGICLMVRLLLSCYPPLCCAVIIFSKSYYMLGQITTLQIQHLLLG